MNSGHKERKAKTSYYRNQKGNDMQENLVLLAGNLTRDPQLRYTQGGTSVADFGMAVNRKFGDKEEVTFVDVTCWGKQADVVGEYLKKGRNVFVKGWLKLDQWENDGQKRSKLTVTAERIQFLGGGSKNVDDSVETKTVEETEEENPF